MQVPVFKNLCEAKRISLHRLAQIMEEKEIDLSLLLEFEQATCNVERYKIDTNVRLYHSNGDMVIVPRSITDEMVKEIFAQSLERKEEGGNC